MCDQLNTLDVFVVVFSDGFFLQFCINCVHYSSIWPLFLAYVCFFVFLLRLIQNSASQLIKMCFCSIFILFCTFTCMLVTDKIRIPMLVYSFVFTCSIYKRSKSYIYRYFMKSRLVDGLMDMLLTCTFADEGLQYHNL